MMKDLSLQFLALKALFRVDDDCADKVSRTGTVGGSRGGGVRCAE